MAVAGTDTTTEVGRPPTIEEEGDRPRPAARAGHRWRPRYVMVAVAGDLVAALAAGMIGSWVVVGSPAAPVVGGGGLRYGHLVVIAGLAWTMVLAFSGAYDLRSVGVSTEEYRRTANAGVRFTALAGVAAFTTQLGVSRLFFVASIPVTVVGTLALRHGLRVWLHRQRLKGRFTKRVVVVGMATTSLELADHLGRSPVAEMEVIGVCVPDGGPGRAGTPAVPVLGRPEEVWAAAMRHGADTIAIADAAALSVRSIRELAWEIEGHQIDVLVVPAVTDIAGPRISLQRVAGLPLIQLDEPRLGLVDRFAKATFDRTFALLGLIVLALPLGVLALLVRATTPGPALFRQERVGADGRPFRICKLRTMVVDAEDHLQDVIHLNEHDGLLFKARQDPRITPIGRFLRSWSLDELPQLWNVLCGHMSIVGPRPPLPTEVEQYDVRTRRRLLMKPGLTGLWQVSGRSELSWEEGIRLDLEYIERWSLWIDAVIVMKTLKAVATRHGAY